MKRFIIALAATVIGTVSVHAESNFDGLYAGAAGGYGKVDADVVEDSAFSGSAFAGYGATFGKVYLGAEAEAGLNGAELSSGGVSIEQKWNYGANARLGYVVSPKVLAYGLAGWQRAELEATDGTDTVDATADGLKFGIGGETFIRENLTARSELTYTDWKGKDGAPDATEIKTTFGLAVRF